MIRPDLVPCEVSAPEHQYGDVMAELNRIGGMFLDLQHRDSKVLIKVGIPHDNVILFEKWLARTYQGNATSTLLADDGDA